MSLVSIAKISSYDQDDEIRDFVVAALRSDPEIESMLSETDPSRVVVVKPNWVQESHEYKHDVWVPVITHPTIVCAVLKQTAQMMQGKGTLVLCDAPHTYANFDAIVARGDLRACLTELKETWPDLQVELIDLRRETWIRKEGVVTDRVTKPDDPRGYAQLDLGKDSLFYDHQGEGRFYGADYDTTVVNAHHHGVVQEYLIAGTPIECDLFINVPKLKTHKKTGITCCLKNLVGINGDKNWLPHHTVGSVDEAGDEYPANLLSNRTESSIRVIGQKVALSVPVIGTWLYRKARNAGIAVLGDSESTIRSGNWSGNDTCWRMALDLNRALLYGNLDGSWRESTAKKHYLAIVDGIVGGEGNGPLCPDPVESGVLLSGVNPAIVDAVAARLMGFDVAQIPIITEAFADHRWPIGNGRIEDILAMESAMESAVESAGVSPSAIGAIPPAVSGGFKPHFGWKDLPLE